jgi:hypothetical protein
MPAPKNNDYASKPASERADSFLAARVRRTDKALWVKAAAARTQRDPNAKSGLAAWVIDALNAQAERDLAT